MLNEYSMMIVYGVGYYYTVLVYIPNTPDVTAYDVNYDELLGLINTFDISLCNIY